MQAFCKHNTHKTPIYKALQSVFNYSHSIVPGGLLVMSYTILFMWLTSLTILVDTLSKTSYGILAQSAVMKSVVLTPLRASV